MAKLGVLVLMVHVEVGMIYVGVGAGERQASASKALDAAGMVGCACMPEH